SIPQSLLPGDDRALKLHLYRSNAERTLKSQIDITQPLFSFLLEGEKQVHFQDEAVHCSPDRALVFSSGHCLMTERAARNGHYASLLFFFSDAAVAALREKHPRLFAHRPGGRQAGFVLEQDAFIRPLVVSLLQLENQPAIADVLLPLK